uniref:AdhE, ctfA and ctfB genes n=1 Tax=Clostridium acetobutylicum TaxID=1488 RepID=Q45814_CLOAT|nr:unnamed protein product [Clostridium acetobutylicum]
MYCKPCFVLQFTISISKSAFKNNIYTKNNIDIIFKI